MQTADAACVQIFNEAKRHKPSILYMPSLTSWSNSVGESVKNTISELLDSLDPSDPILLLAIAQGPLSEIDRDVRSWFGFLKNNRVTLEVPSQAQRAAFFAETLAAVQREPNSYPDAMPRKKRVLEELPIAPPLPAREPTAAEIEQQAQSDARLREYLKFRLGPIVADLKKRFKRFCKPVGEPGESVEFYPPGTDPVEGDVDEEQKEPAKQADAEDDDGIVEVTAERIEHIGAPQVSEPETVPAAINGHTEDHPMVDARGETDSAQEAPGDDTMQADAPGDSAARDIVAHPFPGNGVTEDETSGNPEAPKKKLFFVFHNISLDQMEQKVYRDLYLGPEAFLADIDKIVANVYADGEEDLIDKTDQMLNTARIMVDQACDLSFRQECARMAQREEKRQKAKADKKQKARDARAAVNGSVAAATATEGGASSPSRKRPLDVDGNVDEGSKRQRMDTDMLDATTLANTITNGQSSSRLNGTSSRNVLVPESPSPYPHSGSIAAVNGNATSASLALAGTAAANPAASSQLPLLAGAALPQPVKSVSSSMIGEAILPPSVPATRQVSPELEPEPHAPFYVPQAELQKLGGFLERHTAALSVDELEQLRAACYDAIWRARRDWDKTDLVSEMHELASEFIEELEESKRDD